MDFIDGSQDLAVTARTVPGFLVISLVNLRDFEIRSVHVGLFPAGECDFKPLTLLRGIYLAPLKRSSIIFAYSLSTSVSCDITVLFKVPDEPGILRSFTPVMLPPVTPSVFHSARSWETLLPLLDCSEIDVGHDWAPIDVIQALNDHLGTNFVSLGNFSWGSLDPLLILKCTPASHLWRIYGPDGFFTHEVSDALPRWVTQEGNVHRNFFHLGMFITFLRDYIDAQVDTEWADTTIAKAGQLLRELRIPATLEPIAAMIKGHRSLKELSEGERVEYNRILADIEKGVGSP